MTMIGAFPILDFMEAGVTSVPQCKVIYSSIIGSRVFEGEERSKNEWKEHLLRDSLGWTMWFYATDIIKTAFLSLFNKASDPLKNATHNLLLNPRPKPVKPKAGGLGTHLKYALQRVNWQVNPGGRFYTPTSDQLRERRGQWLSRLAASALSAEEKLAHKTSIESVFKKAITANNYARTIGIILNIALLGFTVPELNILMTEMRNEAEQLKKMEAEEKALKGEAPPQRESDSQATPSQPGQASPFISAAKATSTPGFSAQPQRSQASDSPFLPQSRPFPPNAHTPAMPFYQPVNQPKAAQQTGINPFLPTATVS